MRASTLNVDNGKSMYEYLLRNHGELDVLGVKQRSKIKMPQINDNNSDICVKYLIKGSVKAYLYILCMLRWCCFHIRFSADIVPFLYVVPFVNRFHHKTLKVF